MIFPSIILIVIGRIFKTYLEQILKLMINEE